MESKDKEGDGELAAAAAAATTTEAATAETAEESGLKEEGPPESQAELKAEDGNEDVDKVVPPLEVLRRSPHMPAYRPSSAEIAAMIDGFEDDFKSGEVDQAEDQENLKEEEEEESLADGEDTEKLVQDAQQELRNLVETNEALSRRIRDILDQRTKGRRQDLRDLSKLDGAEARYKAALKQWPDVVAEKEKTEAHYHAITFDLKRTLEEKTKRAEEIADTFKHFKVEVAKSSENSKTGCGIPSKVIKELVEKETEKETLIQKVRLTNIQYRNQLTKVENKIKEKEELAEGLHLIDFEQLKIENQSLNEKIEERNEELMKLRRKTTTTVQILTHIKEKLQFVEGENTRMEQKLTGLEASMGDKREVLQHVKGVRDQLRTRSQNLKEKSTYITSPQLLEDLEAQKERKEVLIAELENLRATHGKIRKRVNTSTEKVLALSEEANNPMASTHPGH